MSTRQNNDQGESNATSPVQDNMDHKGGLMGSIKRSVIRKSKRLSKGHIQMEENKSPEKKDPPNESTSLTSKIRKSLIKKIGSPSKPCQDGEEPQEEEIEEESSTNKELKELLSVMQIHELIEEKDLKKAFSSITFMEQTLMKEYNNNHVNDDMKEYSRHAKDVNLLYDSLLKVIQSIVKGSLDQAQVDKQLISSLVYVINEEGKARRSTLGSGEDSLSSTLLGKPRNWRKLWEEAIRESTTERVGAASLSPVDGTPWLAIHLDCLKTNIVQDLLKVKSSLRPIYPDDYDVSGTYVKCFHDAVSSHLQNNILPLRLEFSQLYCLLDWLLNTYTSDSFLGNPELQSALNINSLSPLLDEKTQQRLKNDYSTALQETIKRYLTNILELEKQKWDIGMEPDSEALEDSCLSPIYSDIEELIGKHVRQSARLTEDLETSSYLACMEELGTFTSSLESEFINWSRGRFSSLCVQYLVIYVNSFIKLRKSTTQSDTDQSKQAEVNLTTAIEHLKKHFFHLFTMETQPQFQKLITKKWLSSNAAFEAIMDSTKQLYSSLRYVIEPLDKDFQNGAHKYLVKEYVTQIMKRKISVNRMKRKKVAEKMRQESNELNCAAQELGSKLERLFLAIHSIADIVGLSREDEIKEKVHVLYKLYPDIEDQHILAILDFQGVKMSKKRSVLEYFRGLKKREAENPENESSERFFSEIECSTHVACFSLGICAATRS